MFGNNPIRKRENDPTRLQVREIFYTIQGEGPYQGHPAVFVRLSGCNLACTFCDTEWDDVKDPYRGIDEILDEIMVKKGPATLVVLTGGEPARQDLSLLIPQLIKYFDIVQLETAGTLWQECFGLRSVKIVVSPKTPRINEDIYAYAAAFKYVVRAGQLSDIDGLPSTSTQIVGQQAVLERPGRNAPVYLSPCDDYDEEANKANLQAAVTSALKHGYRVGVQLHKILGVD